MPVLFVGHGSPMNAIEDNEYRRAWQKLGERLPRPGAILCVSAHWETQGVFVTTAERPETIHDFYGFPSELFAVQYRAPGNPSLARRTTELLKDEQVKPDARRGLDHGCWSVLLAMYPAADVPVVQLSLNTGQPGSIHYNLARKLAPLREEGVLIVGSGNIVHNLRQSQYHRLPPEWAAEFNEEVKRRLLDKRHEGLASYESLGPSARLAVPTPEHYLPLLYVIALQAGGERVEFFNDTISGSISMTSVLIGRSW